MDRVVNENDVHLANYNFDKPIKISYIFEDSESDETETVEDTQLSEKPEQYSSPQNNNLNKSANKPLNKTLSDQNCYSNVGFDDMENGLNIDNDSSTNAEENYNRVVQNQQTINSYAKSNSQTPLGEMRNIDTRMLDYNYLTNNNNTQYSYLLDTVSENLIMILKYYRFYSMHYAKDHKARENYINHKLHYFNQSYNAVIALFLPQENNHVFMRNFIKRTIDIAHRKQRYHSMMLISSLETLLSEMIQWTKQRMYMEKRNNQLNRPPPPYTIASNNTRQMNTQAAVSPGLRGPKLTPASYSVSNTYTRPMSGPVSFITSDSQPPSYSIGVQPPPYSISNISTQQPMRRPPPSSIPTTIPHLVPISNSFSSVNPKQAHGRLPSVSVVPSDLSLPRSSSHNNSYINTQQTMRSLPPTSLAKSSSSLNSFSSANAQQLQSTLPPASLVPPVLPVTRSSSQNNSNIDTRQPTNLPPPVSLIPSVLPQPTTIHSISNVDILQPMNLPPPASLIPSVLPQPTTIHSISNVDTLQPTNLPPPVSLIPSVLPQPTTIHSISNIDTLQPTNLPPPVSLIPSVLPQPTTIHSISNVDTLQPTNLLPPVSLIPSVLPQPTTIHIISNVDTLQPTNLLPPVSLIPSVLPQPTTIHNISNVDTLQPKTSTAVPVVRVPISPASNNVANTNAGIPADNDNTICLFSTGPPGNEISISIDAAIAKIVNEANSSKKVVHKHNLPSKRRKRDDIESPKLARAITNFPPIQNQLQQNNHNCDSSKQLTFAPNANGANTILEPNINFNQLSPGRMQNDKEYDCNKCQTPLVSRSESRDSGFGSPVLNTLLTSNDNSTVSPNCTNNQDFTPEITHVTSMHPDAVFIANGTCKICGTTTKNKCIACYKEYYCGSECQTVDWPFHMQVCTPR